MNPELLMRLLSMGLGLIATYREERDKVLAAGDATNPATGALMSDAEIIDAFQDDAVQLRNRADDLLAKYRG